MARKFLLLFITLAILLCIGVLAVVFVVPAVSGRSVASMASSFSGPQWNNSVKPPALRDPLEVQITAQTTLGSLSDFDKVGCEGAVYKINLPDGKDALVTMDKLMGALQYPLWITGGRNVHVLGLEMRLLVQPGCDTGEGHQVGTEEPSIHPRIPGGKAFRLQQSGTTFIEGVDIDLNGLEADCFVSRNTDELTLEEAVQQRDIYLVNTRCVGIEGLDKSPIGDGVHGDFFQNQGRDDIGSLTLENVTYLTSSNGITLHGWNANVAKPRIISLRNVNYGWDIRFSDDDPYEISGLAFTASANAAMFDNVWLNHGEGLNYGMVNGQRFGVVGSDGDVVAHPELKAGTPPDGDFAPAERTGIEYVSPYR